MVSTKLKEVNAGWESYYAKANDVQLWKSDVEPFLLDHIDYLLSKTPNASILDVGCGDGRNTFIWSTKSAAVTCLDVAKTGLARIMEASKKGSLPTPVLIAEDLVQSSLLDGQFDVVQCFDALAQINDAKGAITRLCSLARSGGHILFNYFTPDDGAYGMGDPLDESTFVYKDTLFKFLSAKEIEALLPDDIEVVYSIEKKWNDPPHGDYRPFPHKHAAVFYLLKRK